MNRKRKQKIISLLLIALLIVTGVKQVVYAADGEPTHFVVADYTELKTTLGSANDGDIITIMGEVIIGNNMTIGSEEKQLIIKRFDADSYLYLKAGDSTFNYCTFEGNGIKTTNSMIKMEGGTQTFNNCTFQNCGSSESIWGNGAIGGAAKVLSGSGVFNECSFTGNYGSIGGSIAVTGEGKVYLNQCTIKDGGAGVYGGAVANLSNLATCEIVGGVITGNQANDFGGGIGNSGTFTVTGVKLYGNSAVNGGADVANRGSGNTTLTDTVEQLNELFSDDNIQVIAWVCDYDFEENIYIPDVDPYQENALLKLQYEIIPDDSEEETETTEPVDPNEPSTDDTEQTPSDEDENTNTTETPTDPSDSEGTDTDNTDDTEEPNTPTEPGTDASDDSEQDTTPDDGGTSEPSQSVGDTNTDNSNNSVNTDNTNNSNNSVNTDNSDNSTHTDNSDNSSVSNINTDNSVTNNDSSNSTTTSNNTVDNSSVDNSKVDNSNVNNNSDSSTTTTNTTTTTNNYYTTESNQASGQATAQPIVIQVENDSDADDEKVSESGSSTPNIRIDAQGVDCVFEYVDGVYNISITAQKETGESDAVIPAVAAVQAVENSTDQEVDWLGIIQIVLLVAILICLIWQPQRTGNRNIQG